MIDFNSFKNVFPDKLIRKLKDSLVPFDGFQDRDQILKVLFSEIQEYSYHPTSPREYIVYNKHNYVARIVPTFIMKDYLLYYFCLKMLEDEIAHNRVAGTYGGWRLGNNMQKLDGKSKDIVKDNIDKLKQLFPDVFTEDGVDFDALKDTLGEYVDDKEERYQFAWHGKT